MTLKKMKIPICSSSTKKGGLCHWNPQCLPSDEPPDTVHDLHTYFRFNGIKGYSKLNKMQLLELYKKSTQSKRVTFASEPSSPKSSKPSSPEPSKPSSPKPFWQGLHKPSSKASKPSSRKPSKTSSRKPSKPSSSKPSKPSKTSSTKPFWQTLHKPSSPKPSSPKPPKPSSPKPPKPSSPKPSKPSSPKPSKTSSTWQTLHPKPSSPKPSSPKPFWQTLHKPSSSKPSSPKPSKPSKSAPSSKHAVISLPVKGWKVVRNSGCGDCFYMALSSFFVGKTWQTIKKEIMDRLDEIVDKKKRIHGEVLENWFRTKELKPHGLSDAKAAKMTAKQYVEHQRKKGSWGGTIELWVAAQLYKRSIVVMKKAKKQYENIYIIGTDYDSPSTIYLLFSANSHYEALVKKEDGVINLQKDEELRQVERAITKFYKEASAQRDVDDDDFVANLLEDIPLIMMDHGLPTTREWLDKFLSKHLGKELTKNEIETYAKTTIQSVRVKLSKWFNAKKGDDDEDDKKEQFLDDMYERLTDDVDLDEWKDEFIKEGRKANIKHVTIDDIQTLLESYDVTEEDIDIYTRAINKGLA